MRSAKFVIGARRVKQNEEGTTKCPDGTEGARINWKPLEAKNNDHLYLKYASWSSHSVMPDWGRGLGGYW